MNDLENICGVLVVNKKRGMTSFDVVHEVSKILGIKKVGHTGTLDPMAEGVLVLTIGRATKLGELLTSLEKEYEAEVKVGFLTDTLDTEGTITKRKEPNKNIDYNSLVNSFKKTYLQEVPIYSAVKVKGKKLYEYARENKEVKLPKKEVTIKNIELLNVEAKSFTFKCLVSKGTYIRSLIRDMGDSVSEYFTMSGLIRTKQGKFSVEDSYTLEDIKNNNYKILSIEEVLDYPVVIVDKELLKKVSNGAKIENKWNIEDRIIFKNTKNNLLVIYYNKDGILTVDKMLFNPFILK